MYIRSTYNNGVSLGWQSNTVVSWRKDGYPASLPYTNTNNYYMALCDIGAGGDNIRNGTYSVMWDGIGDVSFGSNVKILSKNIHNKTALIKINVVKGSTSGVNVRITKTNSTYPLTNVRIVPVAFQHNYTEQIFHPDFLNIVRPFQCLRFTGWQKLTTNGYQSWSTRTLPSYYTQNSGSGVAIEYMIALVNILKPPSVWFSMPLNSRYYNANMTKLLAAGLPSGTSIYYEAGASEVHGDNNRHDETMALIQIFNSAFASVMQNFTLLPTVSVQNFAYVPYIINNWFGSTGLSQIKVVSYPAEFGLSSYSDNYDSSGNWWNLSYANYTIDQLLDEVRMSVLVAERMLNFNRQSLLAIKPSLQFVSHLSGPFFSASNYGYRAGKYSVTQCKKNNKFPCTWANTGYNFKDLASFNASVPMMNINATLEDLIEKKLIEVQRHPALENIYLDFLERWNRIEGGLFMSSYLSMPALRCPTGGHGCGNHGMFESGLFTDCTALPGGCPKYSALLKYKQGIRSTLPFTSADLNTSSNIALVASTSCNPSCVWGTCYKGQCSCFAGYSGAVCDILSTKPPNNCTVDVGMNTAGLVDWSAEWIYVNLFHSSRAWISQYFMNSPWSTTVPANLTKYDYPSMLKPNQVLGAMMMRDLRNHMRAGTFVCLYDGDGIITFSMDTLSERRYVGRIEVVVRPSTGLNNGVFLKIERTNPKDPIRNIRFIMPGFEDKYIAQPFHPMYLDSLKSYKTLRFMDLMNTNGVLYGNWSDRSTNLTRSYSGATIMVNGGSSAGMPIEDMVLLSNIVGSNPWFNMPHLATDEFVRNFAQLVLNTLRPDVTIYVEYSNEVWGTLFQGGIYAQRQGLRLNLDTDPTKARLCYYAYRSSQIFTIWKNVFGTKAYRLKFVYASQHVQPYVSQLILQCAVRLNVETYPTELAIAPYFGTYDSNRDKDLTVFMNVTLPQQIASMPPIILGHKAWAKVS